MVKKVYKPKKSKGKKKKGKKRANTGGVKVLL